MFRWAWSAVATRWNWLLARRRGVLVAALALAAVPTAFDVFPELAKWPAERRIGTFLLWSVAAAGLARGSLAHEERVGRVVEEAEGGLAAARAAVLVEFLRLALSPSVSRIPGNWEVTIYVPFPSTGLLHPLYPERVDDVEDPRVFLEGTGATGQAFKRDEPVFAFGDAVSDDEHGLDDDQQSAFAQYTAVGALPIRGGDGRPIGVISVITALDDGWLGQLVEGRHTAGPGEAVLARVAVVLGDALEALLGDTVHL